MHEPLRDRPDYGHGYIHKYLNDLAEETVGKVYDGINTDIDKMNKIASGLSKVAGLLASEVNHGKYKKDDLVIIDGNKRTIYKVNKIKEHSSSTHSWFEYVIENLRNGKILNMNESSLSLTDEEILDKHGRDASTAAMEMYPKKMVVLDESYGNQETLGRIIDINPKGVLKIQTYKLGKPTDDEHHLPDTEKSEVLLFKPYIYQKEWKWESNKTGQYLKKEFVGHKLFRMMI